MEVTNGRQPLTQSTEFLGLDFKEAVPALCQTAVKYITKNRYCNILAPDDTLVTLESGEYINANLLDVGDNEKLIACQGPLNTTVFAFWSMILQYKSPCILMLTPLMEKGKIKCDKYWPDGQQGNMSNIFIDVTGIDKERILVEHVESMRDSDTSTEITTLKITKGKQEHEVKHIYYYGWQDMKGISNEELYLLITRFLSFNEDTGAKEANKGINVCHCSAGVGRTGVFAAILYCLNAECSPLKAISFLRKQRHGIVQSIDQFRTIVNFINYIASCTF
jgi:protein tyrosine phosphatase